MRLFGALVSAYNDLLREYCATHTDCEFWDFNAIIADPTSASGDGKGIYLRDGLHLGPLGASTLGKLVVAPALARFAPISNLVQVQSDSKVISAISRNVVTNPLMQGTTGTIGSGHSGTLPYPWTSTGNVQTLSTVTRADAFGKDVKTALAATSTSSAQAYGTVDPSYLTPGGSYVLECSLGIDEATAVTGISVTFSAYTTGNIEHRRGFGWPVQVAGATDSIATGDYHIRSRKFTLPSGTITGASITLRIAVGSSSATATARLGRVSLKRI
ncbi:hypothetical protein QEN42_19415 [Gordonia alkanivorans]|uniref:hypothetical protein n=1 Tax=Gordonia alkanivorans TaxID=84096 RepID=UPI00244CB7D3|nr:hypothetical protein [Gordonia alkanivorans]MDH3052007.1 hypothetical protein [Gordonia alkanivorans]